jgi:O-antigen ligase
VIDRAGGLQLAQQVLTAPRWEAALATAIIGTAFGSELIDRTIGLPARLAIVVGLAVLAVLGLVARRGTIGWRGLLPVSLLAFLGWLGLSIVWSEYQWASLGGIAYQFALTLLGLYVGLLRDPIQVVRAVGDVLRVALGVSLAIEIVLGILLDTGAPFLGVQGNLAAGGPIQGIFGARNILGVVAVLAIITFAIEGLTRSVPRWLAIGSVILAVLCLAATQAALGLLMAAIVGVATFALYLLRRTSADRRRLAQTLLAISATIAAGAVFLLRERIAAVLDASRDFDFRLEIWGDIAGLMQARSLQGWGWIGHWQLGLPPYIGVNPSDAREPSSALNAFVDAWLQLGIVGAVLLALLLTLAFVRSWLLASQRHSRVYLWPSLVLTALLASSVAESVLLVDWGWLCVVICVIIASRELSWRQGLGDLDPVDVRSSP